MILQETEKVVAPEKIELTRLEGLACEFVRSARDGGMQAQYLTGFSDAEDQGLAVARCGGEFDPSGTNDVHATRSLAFHE